MKRALPIVITLLAAAGALAQTTQPAAKPQETPAVKPATPPAATQPAAQPGAAAQPTAAPGAAQPASADFPRVKLETSLGDIVLELNAEKAPISTANFIQYVDSGFYNGTIFHRIIPTFMIQGGGMTPDFKEKGGTRPPIKNEWQNGLKNMRGTIAMARTPAPDSATAQFFINVADNTEGSRINLDEPRPPGPAAYAVFGKVVEGMDVVDKIKSTPTKPDSPEHSVPVDPPVIKSATVLGNVDRAKLAARAGQPAPAAGAAAPSAAAQPQEKEVQDYLAKLEKDTGKKPEKTASGIYSVVVKPGSGDSPKSTDVVEVHYTGTLLDGKKFDSSRDRGQPTKFPLNRVIKGWTEGVGLMKPGEQRILVIPPQLAYGAAPPPGSGIPANSWLVFDVELLSVNPK